MKKKSKHVEDLIPTGTRPTHGNVKDICPKTGKVLREYKPEYSTGSFNTWRQSGSGSTSSPGSVHLTDDEIQDTIDVVVNNSRSIYE